MSRSSKKEQIKAFLNKMPSWKKKLWLGLVIGSPILLTLVLIWMFFAHGTTGTFIWFLPVTLLVPILIGIGVAVPLLTLLDINKGIKKETRKHFPSRIIWAFTLIITIIPSVLIGLLAANALHPAGDKAPQLLITSNTGTNGIPDMAVCYWSAAPTQDSLKWGPGALTTTITDTGATTQHTFVLTNLQPNTSYIYQINGAGTVYNFTTPTGSNDWYKFGVSSDPHYGRTGVSRTDISAKIMAQIAKPANNFSSFYMCGDFVEYGMIDSMWKEALDATSPYTSTIPFRPVVGNHDTIVGGTPFYLDYLYPRKMPVGTNKGTDLYHRIDVNNIHIFILDLENGIEQYPGAQKAWFEEQIATIPKNDWTIVMSHCFFYSSGSMFLGMPWYDHPDMIPTFEPLFIQYDVDMVFSGHNHHAEVLQAKGITYFVVGTMGSLPDGTAEYDSPASLWYQQISDEDKFGFFEVDITGNNATVTFRNPNYVNQYNITINK